MKVLQVVHSFLPAVTGGTQNYTARLCRELQKKHRVHLMFAARDLARAPYSVRDGEYGGMSFTEVVNNGMQDGFRETYEDERMDEVFISVLDRVEPDVVHIQHLQFLSLNFIRIAKARGIPVVFTLHDFWLRCPREARMKPDSSICFEIDEDQCAECVWNPPLIATGFNRFALMMVRRLARVTGPASIDLLRRVRAAIPVGLTRRFPGIHSGPGTGRDERRLLIDERNADVRSLCSEVDLFVSPSQFLREEFICFGVAAEKILHSRHGHLAGWAARLQRKPGPLRFGYVGMLARHKGIHVLIDAFNRVGAQDVELNVFGGYDLDLRYVREIARSIENPRIRLRGGFDHDQIGEVYAEIDVLVMPSMCLENAPLTISEAFMAGVPVIASELGGMAELVRHAENGLLFRPGDADDLHEKMRMVIDDRGLLERLARGIEPVKTIEQDARDFEQRYAALIRAS